MQRLEGLSLWIDDMVRHLVDQIAVMIVDVGRAGTVLRLHSRQVCPLSIQSQLIGHDACWTQQRLLHRYGVHLISGSDDWRKWYLQQ